MTPGVDWYGFVEAFALVGVTLVVACKLKTKSRAGSNKNPLAEAESQPRLDQARDSKTESAAPKEKMPWKAGQEH